MSAGAERGASARVLREYTGCVRLSPTRQWEERPKRNGMGVLARSRSSVACTMPIGEPRDPPDEPDGQHTLPATDWRSIATVYIMFVRRHRPMTPWQAVWLHYWLHPTTIKATR